MKELPAGAPTAFIKKRWEKLARTHQGLDRRNYPMISSSNTSPPGWEHNNLIGDYLWPALSRSRSEKLRPLRPSSSS